MPSDPPADEHRHSRGSVPSEFRRSVTKEHSKTAQLSDGPPAVRVPPERTPHAMMDPRKGPRVGCPALASANPVCRILKVGYLESGLLGQRFTDRAGRHAHGPAEGRHKMRGRRKSGFISHLRNRHMRGPQQ